MIIFLSLSLFPLSLSHSFFLSLSPSPLLILSLTCPLSQVLCSFYIPRSHPNMLYPLHSQLIRPIWSLVVSIPTQYCCIHPSLVPRPSRAHIFRATLKAGKLREGLGTRLAALLIVTVIMVLYFVPNLFSWIQSIRDDCTPDRFAKYLQFGV